MKGDKYMIFHLKDGQICDLDYFEEIPVQEIFLDFINYPLYLWIDDFDTKVFNAKEYYIHELIWGYLHPPILDEIITPGEKSRTFKLKIPKDRYEDLNRLRDNIIALVDIWINDKTKANFSFLDGADIRYRINIENGEVQEIYTIYSIDSYCLFALVNLSKRDILIRKCENCGNYFTPSARSDEQYCDEILPNGRTCKQVGWENKSKDDYIYGPYRRAYNRNYQYLTRNRNKIPKVIYDLIYKDFLRWQIDSNNEMNLVRESKISLEDFKGSLDKYDSKLRFLVNYVREAGEITTKEFKDLIEGFNF